MRNSLILIFPLFPSNHESHPTNRDVNAWQYVPQADGDAEVQGDPERGQASAVPFLGDGGLLGDLFSDADPLPEFGVVAQVVNLVLSEDIDPTSDGVV